MKITYKNLIVVLLIYIVGQFSACVQNRNANLNIHQKVIYNKIKSAESTKNIIDISDTIFIRIKKDFLFDSDPILCSTPSGYVIINKFLKKNLIIDSLGNVVAMFGNDGEGPGEYRNIQSACANEIGQIYIFDNILGRISKYTDRGQFIQYTKINELTPYIRHISAYKDILFLHHAPIDSYKGFVTILDKNGNTTTYFNEINGYFKYYERGFLDGAIVSDNSGNIYETDTYSLNIKKINNNKNVIFEKGDFDYHELNKTSSSNYNLLSENYRNATIPIKLFLINNNKLVLQELLYFTANHKKVNRLLVIYDSSGIFLGKLNIDIEHSFDSSDGKYLLKLIDPTLFPNTFKKYKMAFIIRYNINII